MLILSFFLFWKKKSLSWIFFFSQLISFIQVSDQTFCIYRVTDLKIVNWHSSLLDANFKILMQTGNWTDYQKFFHPLYFLNQGLEQHHLPELARRLGQGRHLDSTPGFRQRAGAAPDPGGWDGFRRLGKGVQPTRWGSLTCNWRFIFDYWHVSLPKRTLKICNFNFLQRCCFPEKRTRSSWPENITMIIPATLTSGFILSIPR